MAAGRVVEPSMKWKSFILASRRATVDAELIRRIRAAHVASPAVGRPIHLDCLRQSLQGCRGASQHGCAVRLIVGRARLADGSKLVLTGLLGPGRNAAAGQPRHAQQEDHAGAFASSDHWGTLPSIDSIDLVLPASLRHVIQVAVKNPFPLEVIPLAHDSERRATRSVRTELPLSPTCCNAAWNSGSCRLDGTDIGKSRIECNY